jgi:hypothetical protein
VNPFKKLQHYFIGGALARTDDVFEHVKAEVLVNFTLFFFVVNLSYFLVANHSIQIAMGISVQVALAFDLIILRAWSNVKMASYFFLGNFAIQDIGHFFLTNGYPAGQALLFALLFSFCGFLLLNRWWGFGICIAMMTLFVVGTYNTLHNNSLWSCPPDIADPVEKDAMKYMALIPFSLNIYLVSEFVRARIKAEKQLAHQKRMIEEKQKEILDSIHYAKRIQKCLMPNEKYIERRLREMIRP